MTEGAGFLQRLRRRLASRGGGWSPRAFIARVRHLFNDEIWRPDREESSRLKRLGHRVGRVLFCTFRGFWSQRRTFHAAALTYFSALSIVPFLAFSFSVLKGFGGYRALTTSVIQPWIESTFPNNEPMLRALRQLLAFVEHTDVATLGVVGLLTLAYSAVSLLATIEQAFNDTWGVEQSRPLLRRTTDYVTLLVVTPILAVVGASLTTAAQSSTLMEHFAATPGLGVLIRGGFRLTSAVMVCLALSALYIIMPNTRVRLSAAALGGLVAGVLWQVGLVLQVNSQRAIAGYSALYSGFSAIPIFFVWMYVSWTIVLAGAELASSYQHETVMRQRRRALEADEGFRERLGLEVIGRVCESFLARRARWTAETLAAELRAPIQTTTEVIADLARADLLVRSGTTEPFELSPAADLDGVRVIDVLRALRHRTHPARKQSVLEEELVAPLARVSDDLERETAESERNLTFRELALLTRRALPDSATEHGSGATGDLARDLPPAPQPH